MQCVPVLEKQIVDGSIESFRLAGSVGLIAVLRVFTKSLPDRWNKSDEVLYTLDSVRLIAARFAVLSPWSECHCQLPGFVEL